MKYLIAPLFILASPAIAHETVTPHSHDAALLVPAVAGLLAAASLVLAVRRLARIRA